MTTLWNKVTTWNSKPTSSTFPELESVVIWMRLVLGLAYGWHLGMHHTKGAAGVMFGFNAVAFIPILYCNLYLGADMESFPKVFLAGVVNALALLLLVWIFFYTLEFTDDETKLSSMVLAQQQQTLDLGGDEGEEIVSVTVDSGGEATAGDIPLTGGADSEF